MTDNGLDHSRPETPRHARQRWMIIACIPLLLAVGVLAVAGAAGAAFALMCIGMMVGMMFLMSADHRR